MKLGLIGANGNVGRELCFLLKNDVDLKPIIRNKLGAVFLKHHGFDCTISDISDKQDAMQSLSDVDVVVISSYATDPFSGSQTRSSQQINENIIKNAIKFSKKNAVIIYFSTIRVFSHKVDPSTSRFLATPGYDKDKKHLEKVLVSESKKNNKKFFGLRLGHVFGNNQERTRDFKKIFSKPTIKVQVNPEKKSNVVHTITIKDAILKCLEPDMPSGIFSLVNNPQWTWKEVIDSYKNPETNVEYKRELINSVENNFFWNILKSNKKFLAPLRYYISPKFDSKINKKLATKRMIVAISNLKTEDIFYTSAFNYEPIPGPFLNNLEETNFLLKNYNLEFF
jgi:dTDP-4-dehydrorhamnose reductase